MQTPTPSFTCVGGMLRVLTEATDPPSHPQTSTQQHHHPSPTLPEPSILTQKQVRELRRLCRKTANRAEFDDRLIQVRQIASIAAMGTPSAKFFDPANPISGFPLRQWVLQQREQGADWKDERPLPDDAIDELRRWDRALKAWARLRFDTSPSRPSPPTANTPHHPTASNGSSPITPHTWKRRHTPPEYSQFSSPVSPDTQLFVPSPSPETSAVQNPYIPEKTTPMQPLGALQSTPQRSPLSEVSISRDGDTINITVPTLPMSNTHTQNERTSINNRSTARDDQENQYPPMRRPSYIHAADTAKSWRTNNAGSGRAEAPIKSGTEIAYQTAAKNLFASSARDAALASNSKPTNQTTQRSAMDWGKLRRPVLGTISLNSNMQNWPPSDSA